MSREKTPEEIEREEELEKLKESNPDALPEGYRSPRKTEDKKD